MTSRLRSGWHNAAWSVRAASFLVRQPWRGREAEIRAGQDATPVLDGLGATTRLRAALHSLRPGRDRNHHGEIWAVTMVRNEEDIIVHAVENLLAQGVDRVLVADNLSTDATRDVLLPLVHSGRVILISDMLNAYWQSEKMTRLARLATLAGAEWIVPFDADEIWLTESGLPLRAFFDACDADIVFADMHHYAPIEVSSSDNPVARYQLREPASGPKKVAFRSNYLARIWTGNHTVLHPGVATGGLTIAHYPYRSFEQMERKIRIGAKALEATTHEVSVGSHWRHLARNSPEEQQSHWQELVARSDLVHDPVPIWRVDPDATV